jgi:bacterioferritin (cytochrome b1)
MSSPETIDVLNRVLTILWRSFPQYLRYARPYLPPGSEHVVEMFAEIAAGQDALAERVHELILQSGALPDVAPFPMEFTDTHDLDIDYLIREAIGYQKQDIANLKQCAESLQLAPAAKTLAEEALGMAKGHLESLEELASDKRPVAAV